MADDFERAVLICFNLGLGNVDARLKASTGQLQQFSGMYTHHVPCPGTQLANAEH